jgi:hypothetical protein
VEKIPAGKCDLGITHGDLTHDETSRWRSRFGKLTLSLRLAMVVGR